MLRLIVALLLFPMFLPYVWWRDGEKLAAAMDITGIIATLIGTLWLAAGVYVSSGLLAAIQNQKPKKAIQLLTKVVGDASRPVLLGAIYLLLGASFLVARIVFQAHNWL